MRRLAKFVKSKLISFDRRGYRWLVNRTALRCLKNIEATKGKTDPRLIKQADEYASDVLGNRVYAPWLYVYSATAEAFKEGWIPESYYRYVVVPRISGYYFTVSTLNSLNKKLFGSPVFPDVVHYINGLFLSDTLDVIPEKTVKDYLFGRADRVVFKLDHSGQGKGIHIFDKHSLDLSQLGSYGNGTFQRYIEQHEELEELTPNSVATLRITTVIDRDGNGSVRGCILKLGRSTETHIRGNTHIAVPVDQTSGELGEEGFTADWFTVDKHPDNDKRFAHRSFPCFDKCRSTVLGLHRATPIVRCIGWDVTTDRNNDVQVMEWNGGYNGIVFMEAAQGPCFSDMGWDSLWRDKS